MALVMPVNPGLIMSRSRSIMVTGSASVVPVPVQPIIKSGQNVCKHHAVSADRPPGKCRYSVLAAQPKLLRHAKRSNIVLWDIAPWHVH
jgi:hypothetical protein